VGEEIGPDRRELLGSLAVATWAFPGVAAAAPSAGPIAGGLLRTEWLVDPVGLDTLRPRFTWKIAADDTRGVRQSGYRLVVGSSRAAVAQGRGDLWDSGRVSADRPAAQAPRPLRLRSHTPYHWAVMLWDGDGRPGRWSEPARFVTGMLDPAEWQAQWIAARADRPQPVHVRGSSKVVEDDLRLPIFRCDFTAGFVPVQAFVSVVGLGQHELSVNGAAVTSSLLNPAWSDYAKTVLYDTYDVTRLIRPGANALGVMLGNGMYNVERAKGRYTKFVDSFGSPKLLLRLTLIGAGGEIQHVVSDAGWQTRPGPILFSSIYGGEDVDGRFDLPGWDRPGKAGEGWFPVLAVKGPGGQLRAQGVPPIVVAERLKPVAVTHPSAGVAVYDFGENFAGRPELVLRGPAGAKVSLLPGEALGPDGLPNQRSYNARPDAAVSFSYVLAGRGEERFVPRFSYQGFRYLQVTADPGVEVVSATGQFIHADMAQVGEFDSSNGLFVRIHGMINQSVRSNMMSVLTDCPHREKLGWLEQTYLNASTILCNRDAITLYEKMVVDIADAQQANGMVPGIAPEYVAFINPDGTDMIYRNSPEWGISAVLSPWAAYRTYGDPAVLERGYPAMQRYLAYLATQAKGGLLDFGMGDWYDVGPKDPGPSQLTSRAVTATLVWYEGLITAARIATVLGRAPAEAARYQQQASAVARAFLQRFAKGDGLFDTGSQTAQAMPLALGIVPAAERDAAMKRLVAAIRATGNGVTAGDVGFHYVVDALTAGGRDDVMFDMMSVTDRPSYGYQLAHGATALAESWDANPTKSLNHFMLGHGEGWLYQSLAGVRVDFAAGAPERVLTFAPRPVGDVRSAGARYRSVLGQVECRWERRGAAFALDATVPAGATATVRVPTMRPDAVREAGGRAVAARGVRSSRQVDGALELVVGSGRYRFLAPA